MKWLLDANVIVDNLLDRKPHAEASSGVWKAVEESRIEGVLSAHAVTTVYYLLRKERGNTAAQQEIYLLTGIFTIAAVDSIVIEKALSLGWSDFEDAVSAMAAECAGCDLIVTRNPKHFRNSLIPVYTPGSALALLSKH